MSSDYILSSPDELRHRLRQRKIIILTAIFSLGLFSYPEVKRYWPKWQALRAASHFSTFISGLRTQSMLKRIPLEIKMQAPDVISIYEVSSCGPNATSRKLWNASLSEYAKGVEFAQHYNHPLTRICYDPLYGSSLLADGLANGVVILAHRHSLALNEVDQFSRIIIQGPSGEVDFSPISASLQ